MSDPTAIEELILAREEAKTLLEHANLNNPEQEQKLLTWAADTRMKAAMLDLAIDGYASVSWSDKEDEPVIRMV